ncbi:hypothetical protein BDN70DRAFT_921596 [Pholiota conissans]|uniref:Uncharacterized protein n=1 Tax=Pholiota conissans TaxID=109636 RepID=A0A9P6D025_9AGAR|nr:hypothetical protein BDN70DRAFT_921596 [Pholiota conissans]
MSRMSLALALARHLRGTCAALARHSAVILRQLRKIGLFKAYTILDLDKRQAQFERSYLAHDWVRQCLANVSVDSALGAVMRGNYAAFSPCPEFRTLKLSIHVKSTARLPSYYLLSMVGLPVANIHSKNQPRVLLTDN